MDFLNDLFFPVLAALSAGGNAVQWLYTRSLKRIKSAEADIKEIEGLRLIIDQNSKEIERLHRWNTEMETKYRSLQDEYTALAEELRKLKEQYTPPTP